MSRSAPLLLTTALLAASLLAPTTAIADDPLSEDALQAAWDATADPVVAASALARDAAGLQFTVGPSTYAWKSGSVLPIAPAGSDDPWDDALGFVIQGEGSITTGFDDRGEALAFANHLATKLDVPVADAKAVRDGMQWTSPVSVGFVLTARPDVLNAARTQAELATDDKATGQAQRIVDKRLDLLRGGQDPIRMVRLDAMLAAQRGGDASHARVLVDVDTDRALELEPRAKHGGNRLTRDSWLTQVYDESGLWSTRNVSELGNLGEFEAGGTSWRTVASQAFPRAGGPDDHTSPPMPPMHWEPIHADNTVQADVAKGRNVLEIEATSQMVLAPRGGPGSWLVVEVPFHEERKESWELQGITATLADGTELPVLDLPAEPTDRWDKRYAGSSNLVVLGRPLDEGEALTLTVQWKDTLPWANLSTDPSGTGARSLGHGTGLQSVIPAISPGLVGNPWPFTTRVGLPADDDHIDVAISGLTTRTWTEDGRRWTEASSATPAMWADVALGDWISLEAPAPRDDLPALRVHLFRDEAQALPGVANEAYKVIDYYQRILPPFPWKELEIFQSPDMWFGFVWIAPHAMVASTQAKVITGMGKYFTEDAPHLSEGVLAHEIAHQYWGHVARPASIKDFWIAETFAETFSCLYVGATYGEDAYRSRMDEYKKTWEQEADAWRASLTAAYESGWQPTIVYNYGPYVMLEMLRPRIGDEAFFKGLYTLLAAKPEQPVATEEIQLVFEAASDQDLSDFFDYWVEGGYVPALSMDYAVTGSGRNRRVEGTVHSDVPLGTIDVPVVVRVGTKKVETWVTLVDGHGDFTTEPLPGGKGSVEVELDPDGRVLASSRKAKAR
ncbi:MAG: hypothetical protein D6798_08485 [Deltaproteobacteria bacterium]|nr:MAG: hypothetical protein D6798_08485 [Deltaproteobacteria bacterium]